MCSAWVPGGKNRISCAGFVPFPDLVSSAPSTTGSRPSSSQGLRRRGWRIDPTAKAYHCRHREHQYGRLECVRALIQVGRQKTRNQAPRWMRHAADRNASNVGRRHVEDHRASDAGRCRTSSSNCYLIPSRLHPNLRRNPLPVKRQAEGRWRCQGSRRGGSHRAVREPEWFRGEWSRCFPYRSTGRGPCGEPSALLLVGSVGLSASDRLHAARPPASPDRSLGLPAAEGLGGQQREWRRQRRRATAAPPGPPDHRGT